MYQTILEAWIRIKYMTFSHAREFESEAEKENGSAEDFRMQTLEKSYRKVKGCDIPLMAV